MQLGLTILIDSDFSSSLLGDLTSHLMDIFPLNQVDKHKLALLPHSCWDVSRQQYNANCLLGSVVSPNHNKIVLLIVTKDTYVEKLNFVFGVASTGIGAVVSVFRLEKDPEFIQKEITHELGHVFGLKHCSLPCVMTFSNSVWEAKQKSSNFCEKCITKINQFMNKKLT